MMRFIAFVLRPVIPLKIAWSVTVLILMAGPICGAVIGIKQVVPRANGWHTTTAVVVKPGTKPVSNENEAETRSVVRYNANGEIRKKTLYLAWYKREGAHVHLWVKGVATRQSSPTGFFVVIWRPLLWTLLGLIASAAILFQLKKLENAINRYKKRAESRRVERDYADRVAPDSLQALLQLCHDYGDCKITVEEAHSYGACMGGVRHFRDQEFPGRSNVTLAELAPLLERPREGWPYICTVVVGKLKNLGVITPTFQAERIPCPPLPAKQLETA